MEFWVTKLREQTAQIMSGIYPAVSSGFNRAPAGMANLSRDLDALGVMVAKREAARKSLTREVHHRVKNNLQIITSLLTMQARSIDNPACRQALGQTRARIDALALIHRIIYDQGDDGSQTNIDGELLIAELCNLFRLSNQDRQEIRFTCHADPMSLPLDNAMPLALFTVEAVTNAYAHAFPIGRSGTVALSLELTGYGAVQLAVIDDGLGFDSAAGEGSMGRKLMLGFARQLDGNFTIVSIPGTGTEVRLDYQPDG